jgi:integrase
MRAEVIMQNGSVVRRTRKLHSDIWQFRWREKTSDGKRIYRRKQIGTVDQIPDLETARKAERLLVPDLNARMAKSKPVSMTIAQLCSHFEQCELSLANTWRSYSTKTIYKVYLTRWIIPQWSEDLLSDSRTIDVESWLR